MSVASEHRTLMGRSHFFAVGTVIADRPPHRTVRAQFTHTAPASGA